MILQYLTLKNLRNLKMTQREKTTKKSIVTVYTISSIEVRAVGSFWVLFIQFRKMQILFSPSILKGAITPQRASICSRCKMRGSMRQQELHHQKSFTFHHKQVHTVVYHSFQTITGLTVP